MIRRTVTRKYSWTVPFFIKVVDICFFSKRQIRRPVKILSVALIATPAVASICRFSALSYLNSYNQVYKFFNNRDCLLFISKFTSQRTAVIFKFILFLYSKKDYYKAKTQLKQFQKSDRKEVSVWVDKRIRLLRLLRKWYIVVSVMFFRN